MPFILVVDDELPIRKLLRHILEEAGYDVIEASDGEEAMRLARGVSIALLITDLVMPRKEGIELIQEFRKAFTATKIIAMSGVGCGQYLRMAALLGADAALMKPFDAADLLATVARLLSEAHPRVRTMPRSPARV
jgi:DNA-binding response OmpR family regulator